MIKTKKDSQLEGVFGKITLERNKEGGVFVPNLMEYGDHGKLLETLAYSIKENMPTLLIGETGVGKTSAVRYLAAVTNNNLRRVNVNGSMTAEDFVGQLLVNNEGTYWKDGVLTECMRNGYWLVIDEINAASAEILFVLHSLLDDDHYIVLTDHPEREIVHAHPNFRIFATMNPPERYSGTKEMNKALLSRFPMTLTIPLPPDAIEFGLISGADSILKPHELKGFKKFVGEMRNAYNKEEMEVFISPRDLGAIMKVYLFTGNLIEAVEKTIMPRGSRSEQKAIMDTARLNLSEKESPKGEAAQSDGAKSEEDIRLEKMIAAAERLMAKK